MTKHVSLSSITHSHFVRRDKLSEGNFVRPRQQDDFKQDEKGLRDACAEFESLFIYQIVKQMRRTILKSGLNDGGKGEEIFTSMMDEELSKQIASRQGLGLKDVLIEQLTGTREKTLPQRIAAWNYSKNSDVQKSEHPFILPVMGEISSAYGWRRDPFTGKRDFHHGIDIASPSGSEVFATEGGRIVFSGWKQGYGRMVEIEHKDGLSTIYAHNSKNLVKEGENVNRYQPIALVGNSGKSTGPHLHYEVRENGDPINPTTLTHISMRR